MPERILLIRLSAIGDVINTLPALSLLRRARPDAYLAFAVEDRARDLLWGHPFLDGVHVFPRRAWRGLLRSGDPRHWLHLRGELAAYRRALQEARYDVALDFQGNLKGALHAILSGAPRRVGFARGHDREWSHCFATEHVVPPADRPHRVDKFVSLLGPLGIEGREREFVLPPTPAEVRGRVHAWLQAAGLDRAAPVLLHPGTSERGAAKRWPAERFAALAARLVARGMAVLVTWGPGERALAEEVVMRSGCDGPGPRGRSLVRLGPETSSLLELAELIRHAAVFVSSDTGPMHLAAACGTRCVALFGPKDPAVYRPYGEAHTVLYHPNTRRGAGMLAISVEEVLVGLLGPASERAL